MTQQILIAHDGSDGARKAFDFAVDLTARLGFRATRRRSMSFGRRKTGPVVISASLPTIAGCVLRCIP
jgi:hypothetical protein